MSSDFLSTFRENDHLQIGALTEGPYRNHIFLLDKAVAVSTFCISLPTRNKFCIFKIQSFERAVWMSSRNGVSRHFAK